MRQGYLHQQFEDIIIANSPVTREVWPCVMEADLDLKVSLAAIIAAQRTDTVRTVRVIEREKEMGETERFQVAMDYLDIFMDRDTIPDSTYLAIHYMVDSLATKEWQWLAAGTAISLDTLTWAKDLLLGLDLENAEDSAFFALHYLAVTLKEDTLSWMDMDSTQRALIAGIAEGGTLMRENAQTILALLSDTSVARWPEQIPEAPSFKLSEEEEEEETDNPESGGLKAELVKVYPNPFQNTFTVQYEFADDVHELRFEVFDLTGRRVKDLLVQQTRSGSQTLSLDGCKGLYLLRVSADNRMVRTEKLICLER